MTPIYVCFGQSSAGSLASSTHWQQLAARTDATFFNFSRGGTALAAGRREIRPAQRRLIEAYLSGYRPADWPLEG